MSTISFVERIVTSLSGQIRNDRRWSGPECTQVTLLHMLLLSSYHWSFHTLISLTWWFSHKKFNNLSIFFFNVKYIFEYLNSHKTPCFTFSIHRILSRKIISIWKLRYIFFQKYISWDKKGAGVLKIWYFYLTFILYLNLKIIQSKCKHYQKAFEWRVRCRYS